MPNEAAVTAEARFQALRTIEEVGKAVNFHWARDILERLVCEAGAAGVTCPHEELNPATRAREALVELDCALAELRRYVIPDTEAEEASGQGVDDAPHGAGYPFSEGFREDLRDMLKTVLKCSLLFDLRPVSKSGDMTPAPETPSSS